MTHPTPNPPAALQASGTSQLLGALATLAEFAATDERATAYLERLWSEANTCADVYGNDGREEYVATYVARGIVQAMGGAS